LNKKTSYGYIGAMLVMVEDEADNKHYYSHDGLGSIIAIYDASGNYVNVYMYDEFGNFLQKSETIANSYYYTGQELDRWSGLYNLRNRYYNASLGRFTQLDPIVDLLGVENMQELNGYAYVANNPMVLVDPFGLCGEDRGFWYYFIEELRGYHDPVPQPGESWESYYTRFYVEYSSYMIVSEAVGVWGGGGVMIFTKEYMSTGIAQEVAYNAIANPSWAGRIGGKLVLKGSFKAWQVTGNIGKAYKTVGSKLSTPILVVTGFATSYRAGLKTKAWINWKLANRIYRE